MIIFILFILILNKYNKSLALNLKNNLFNKSINFVKINKLSQRLLGKDVFYYQSKESDSMVIASQFNQNKKNKYFDGEKILVSSNLPIGSISSGVVVYIGNKENYNNTIIIQGLDGYNIWYGNITNVNAPITIQIQFAFSFTLPYIMSPIGNPNAITSETHIPTSDATDTVPISHYLPM